MTRLPLAALISSLALIGAACGGSDTADAPTTAAPTTAAPTTAAPTTAAPAAGDSVDLITADVVSQASASGLVVDSACVADIVRKLSDADQQLLVDSIGDDMADPALSAEGEALGAEIIGCADKGGLVDMMMASMGSIPGMDADCVRGVLEEMDLVQLMSLSDNSSAGATEFSTKLMACMKGS